MTNEGTVKLTEIGITKNSFGTYHLYAFYDQETERQELHHEISAPLPLHEFSLPSVEKYMGRGSTNGVAVDFGFGTLFNAKVKTTVTKEKVKKMTLKDIEKALGYSIELVEEEQNE